MTYSLGGGGAGASSGCFLGLSTRLLENEPSRKDRFCLLMPLVDGFLDEKLSDVLGRRANMVKLTRTVSLQMGGEQREHQVEMKLDE